MLKFSSWNLEHSDKLLDALASSSDRTRRQAEARRDAIGEEIAALGAHILLITEGPHGEARAADMFAQVAPDYDVVIRGSDSPDDYGMKGGNGFAGKQWIWFLVRRGAGIAADLLHLDRWRDLVENNSGGEHKDGRWDVSYPTLKDGQLVYEIDKNHVHWRHPQVLQVHIGGAFLEIIGCHLKSKFTRVKPVGDVNDDAFFRENQELVAEIVKARIKISTECADIRHYIDQRFAADANAAIIVAGDLNDGPGKERIERRFLYHDLVGSLQGEIFFAKRFLNHALFDAEEEERWSVFFEDALDPKRDPRILLDHILFSQSFTGNPNIQPFAYRARKKGGLVEHGVHHAVTGSRPQYAMTSDHLPVSMVFERRSDENV